MQRTAVFPVHFAGGSLSHLGDSSWMNIKTVHYARQPKERRQEKQTKSIYTVTSPISMASSVKVATVKTTPSRPSTAKVMACASLATKTAALEASLSRLHSIPTEKIQSPPL